MSGPSGERIILEAELLEKKVLFSFSVNILNVLMSQGHIVPLIFKQNPHLNQWQNLLKKINGMIWLQDIRMKFLYS